MTEPIVWRSWYRGGDCFWHSLFLRKIGGSHIFYCREDFQKELHSVIEGCDVELRPIQDNPDGGIDAWIGSDQKPNRSWYAKGCPNDVIGFLLEWFAALSEEIGVETPFKERQDFLADYPALFRGEMTPILDYLIINADPQSGQCPGYVPDEMHGLIQRLADKCDDRGRHNCLIATNPTTANVPQVSASFNHIGYLSLFAKTIIAVATGPMWPTWNVRNKATRRYLLLDPIRIDYGTGCVVNHAGSVSELASQLERDGVL